MKSPYVIRPLAKKEFLNSVAWYEERRSGLGKRFAAAVERRLEVIAIFHTSRDPQDWMDRV